MSDDHSHATPHVYTGHEHIEQAHGAHRASHKHLYARGFRLKKHIALAVATGGGVVAAVHLGGGFVVVHVVLPILLGVAIWQWWGGIVVGFLIVGAMLYLGVHGKFTK